MIKRIKRILNKIESFDKSFRPEIGDNYVEVFKNPSSTEISKLFRAHEIIRGWTDTNNDVYIWDGSLATHWDVADEYDNLAIRFFLEDAQGEKYLGVYSDSEEQDSSLERRLSNTIRNNPNTRLLINFVEGDVRIVFGEYDAGDSGYDSQDTGDEEDDKPDDETIAKLRKLFGK